VAERANGPAGGEFDAAYYMEERYASADPSARARRIYYRLKPLMPRHLQIALRRLYARRIRRRLEAGEIFPRWPIEPILVERRNAELRDELLRTGADRVPFVRPWPRGHRFAYILTHDVEGPRGVANIERVLEVERRHGMVSSWNLVADDYAVDPAILDSIRRAGGEIGLHGLTHDARLFESRESFTRQLPRIHEVLRSWGADGFRSPALHRNAAWMRELGCSYDSSFPDTDPFEPQPGGCCSILPYFLGDVVELPITLVQDHTLWQILQQPDISMWRQKAAWLAREGGLITVLVHPDYMLEEQRLAQYDELLGFLAGLERGWHALPRHVARWWRQRATLEAALASRNGVHEARLEPLGASLGWAYERDGEIVIA
jgi:peptidoglycan/xylan/chitin deacetylase (PgdA/CDA1 family)